MTKIMTDQDIWPMLCKAIPSLSDIPLVTSMTLELNIENKKVPIISITRYVTDCSNPHHNHMVDGMCQKGGTYRLQQNGQDVATYRFWEDLCSSLPLLKGLAVTKTTLRVTPCEIVTMALACEMREPEGGQLLSQTYELVEVKV